MSLTLILVAVFMVKHCLADFVLQTPYQVSNKGRLFHPGGLIHVGIHLALTLGILLLFVLPNVGATFTLIAIALAAEAVVHYCMDFTKCAVVRATGWTCADSYYWWITGFDQLVHGLTYVGILALFV